MAKGYDAREPARATFTFQPQAPRQRQAADAGAVGRVGQVGGGQTRGGVVQSANPAISASIGTSIPAFLEKVFEPAIQRASQERMYQGYADAISGKTMQEVVEQQPALRSLFGPTDYEQGASVYHAQAGLESWKAAQLENMDELSRLSPDEVGRVLFDGAQPFLTGDVGTDNLVHRMVIEASGDLIPQITTARISRMQGERRNAMTSLIVSRGENLRNLAASYASLDPAAGEEGAAEGATVRPSQELLSQSASAFLDSLVPIGDMPTEDWQAVIEQTANLALGTGNFHMWTMLNTASEEGGMSPLFAALGATGDGAKYAALQTRARTAVSAAYSELMLTNPALQRMRTQLEADIAFGTVVNAEGKVDGEALAARHAEINSRAMALLGTDIPLYTAQDTLEGQRALFGSEAQRLERLERREQELRDRVDEREERRRNDPNTPENRAKQAEEDRAGILAMIETGDITFSEYPQAKVDEVMVAQYRANPQVAVAAALRLHQNAGTVLPSLAEDMKARLRQNISGGADAAGFQEVVAAWRSLGLTPGPGSTQVPSPNGLAMRAAYYGTVDVQLETYTRMVDTGAIPEVAFAQVFLEQGALPGSYRSPVSANLPAAKAATIRSEIASARQGVATRWLQAYPPTAPSVTVRQELIGPAAAAYMQANPNIDAAQAVQNAEAQLLGANVMDRAGRWYWETPMRTRGMNQLTNLPEDRLARAVDRLVRTELRGRVFEGMDASDIAIVQTEGESPENAVWWMYGHDRNGRMVGRRFTVATIQSYDRLGVEEDRLYPEADTRRRRQDRDLAAARERAIREGNLTPGGFPRR